MTNDSLSQSAIDAIGTELLNEEVESVEIKCTVSSDDSEFDVYDNEGSYLLSVTNSGVSYNK